MTVKRRPLRVLVCGDRAWNDPETIRKRLVLLPAGTLIIHGDQGQVKRRRDGSTYWIGADTQADHVAKALGLKTDPHPADWNKYGLAAGPRRNREMLDLKPDLVIAFHRKIEYSKGTKDTVEEAKKRGIKVEVII